MSRPAWIFSISISCVVALPWIKRTMQPSYKTFSNPPRKTIIITGATSNLGVCLSSQLAHYNQRVIMACKDMDKCRSLRREIVFKTQNKAVACRHLDLSSIDSINKFADNILKTEPKIDVIINNAAIREPSKTLQLNQDGIEMTYFVNYLGPYLLTIRLIDKLIEASKITDDSRIVNIIGKPKKTWKIDINDINFERREYKPNDAYTQSKLALAYFTRVLHEYMKENKHKVYVYGIDPGFKKVFDSGIRETSSKQTFKILVGRYTSANPERVVGSTIRCAIQPDYGNRESSGFLYGLFGYGWSFKKPVDDLDFGKFLWNKSADFFLNHARTKNTVNIETKET